MHGPNETPTKNRQTAYIYMVSLFFFLFFHVHAGIINVYGAWLVDREFLVNKCKTGSRVVFKPFVAERASLYVAESFVAKWPDHAHALTMARRASDSCCPLYVGFSPSWQCDVTSCEHVYYMAWGML